MIMTKDSNDAVSLILADTLGNKVVAFIGVLGQPVMNFSRRDEQDFSRPVGNPHQSLGCIGDGHIIEAMIKTRRNLPIPAALLMPAQHIGVSQDLPKGVMRPMSSSPKNRTQSEGKAGNDNEIWSSWAVFLRCMFIEMPSINVKASLVPIERDRNQRGQKSKYDNLHAGNQPAQGLPFSQAELLSSTGPH